METRIDDERDQPPVRLEMPKGGRPVSGARLRQAMEEAGLSIAGIAQSLSVARTTVHRWYSEDRTPEPYLLQEFAALVNRPVEWFYQDDQQQVRSQIESGVMRVLKRLAEEPALPTLNAVQIEVPEHRISEEERAWIQASEQTIRLQLQQLCRARFGRPWPRLTTAERGELVRALLAEPAAEE